MGGLVTRYTAGRLYADGYFQSVTALNFVTIATPHLGSWRMPANLLTRGFNAMVPILTSRSGFQLVFQDKSTFEKPLLCLMSHPKLPFMAGLRQFQNLVAMANIHHDRPVPYCTAAFALSNPYESAKAVPIDPRYPSIVRPHDAQAGDAPAPAERAVQGKSMRLLLVVFLPLMLAGLAYMTVQGKRHYAASKKLNYNTDWLAAYCHKQLQQLPAVPNANASDGSVAAAPAAEAEADAEAIDVAIDADAAVAADCPSAPTGVGLGPDGGEVIVSETQQSVVLHEGIVELPSAVHEVQVRTAREWLRLPSQNCGAHPIRARRRARGGGLRAWGVGWVWGEAASWGSGLEVHSRAGVLVKGEAASWPALPAAAHTPPRSPMP